MQARDLIRAIALPLAVWRLAYMLTHESGPFAVFETLRYQANAHDTACAEQQHTGITNPLCCLWCTSVWVSLALLPLTACRAGWWVIYWLAASAAAIVVDNHV